MRDAFPTETPDVACARIAATQHGVIHRSQAIAAGLSRSGISRRCDSGLWRRVLPQVYVMSSARPSWLQTCTAAWFWAGPEAAIGFETAAALLGLTAHKSRAVHVVTTEQLKAPRSWIVVHRARLLTVADVAEVEGIRVTTAARTLLDWADETDEETLEEGLDVALRRRLATLARVRWQLDREGARGRRGCRALRELLERRMPGSSESPLETRFGRLIRRSGLPTPEAQYVVANDGRVVARVDFAYPEAKLAVELDGYEYHSSRVAWSRDRARANVLVGLGWRIFRFTWEDVNDAPEKVVRILRDALH